MADNDKTAVHGYVGRLKLTLLLGSLCLLVLLVLFFSARILLLFFTCVLLAIVLYDGSRKFERWLKLPHLPALALFISVCLLVIGIAVWLLAPAVGQQAHELLRTIPLSLQRLQAYVHKFAWLDNMMGDISFSEQLMANTARILPLFSGVIGAVANIVIVVFVGIYLAAQPKVYIDGLVTLMPQAKRMRTRQVLDELGETLAQWLLGKGLSMLVVGIITALGLYLLKVPLALVLGVIAGVLDFIPYIGPVLAAMPAILIGIANDPLQGLYVLLFFIVVQNIEGYVLLPMIERRTVSLPPALTIAMQVLLGSVFGLAGVALATPLTAVLTVLIAMLYVQDVLGDPVRTPAQH